MLLGRCRRGLSAVGSLLQGCHVGQAPEALVEVQAIPNHKLVGALHGDMEQGRCRGEVGGWVAR